LISNPCKRLKVVRSDMSSVPHHLSNRKFESRTTGHPEYAAVNALTLPVMRRIASVLQMSRPQHPLGSPWQGDGRRKESIHQNTAILEDQDNCKSPARSALLCRIRPLQA